MGTNMKLSAARLEQPAHTNHIIVPLQNTDPRAKLLAALLLGLGAIVCGTWPTALGFLLLALALTCLLGPGLRALGRVLLPINFFLLFTWLTLPFTFTAMPGDLQSTGLPGLTIPLFWGLHLYQPGLMFCVLSTLKTNAAAIFLLSLTYGLNPARLGDALRALGLPAKLCTLFIMTCRHIFILKEEFQVSLRALRLRPKAKGVFRNLKLYAFFMGSVLIHAANRAEKVRLAMLCKGCVNLSLPEMHRHSLVWSWRDSVVLLLSALPLIAILLITVLVTLLATLPAKVAF